MPESIDADEPVDASWNQEEDVDYIKRANWSGAILMLLLAGLGPILVGAGFLYEYGVDKDSPIAKSIRAQRPPEEVAVVQTPVQIPASSVPLVSTEVPSSSTDVSQVHDPIDTLATSKLEKIEALLSQLDTQKRQSTERLYWESIKTSTNKLLLSAYLEQYPNGAFESIARIRLDAHIAQERSRIAELERLSQRAYARDSLTVPSNDNAVMWAEEILKIQPDNNQAKVLLNRVIDTYLDRAANAFGSGKQNTAKQMIARAQSLYPYASNEQLLTVAALSSSTSEASSKSVAFEDRGSALGDLDIAGFDRRQPLSDISLDVLLRDVRVRLGESSQEVPDSFVSAK